ncbi:hypothetical protein CHUAL_010625 [Chamberlinius hualienensis]
MSPLEKQTSSTTSANRRSNKPIMEKKRRARINNCLNELKNLLLEAMKKDPTRHSKLEKADILEMTVRHLQQLKQRQRQLGSEPEVQTKYKAGFRECADEVQRYVNRFEGMEVAVKQRLLGHLSNCVKGFRSEQSTQPTANGIYLNNNGVLLNLTPSRLPSGEMAFVLPREWTNSTTTNNKNNGLLMTSTQNDNFPPLTINCSSSASPSTSASESPTNSDYSGSDSSASFNFSSHFNAFQKMINSSKRLQMTIPPSTINFDRVSMPSRWSNEMEYEDMQLPVDLSSAKDAEGMWRPCINGSSQVPSKTNGRATVSSFYLASMPPLYLKLQTCSV